MAGRLLCLAASLLLTAPQTLAVQAQPPFRAGVELVTIPVTVLNKEGRRVLGLAPDDLTLEEDGVAQDISVFSAEPQPVAISVLVDYSGSMRGDRIDAALAAVRAVGEAMTAADYWNIGSFADRHQVVVPWSRFDENFFDRMRRAVTGGGTRMFAAVVSANETLITAPLRKRAIVLISDGNDLSTQVSSDFSGDLDSLTHAGSGEATATSALRRGEFLLYALGMDWPYRAQRPGARGPSERVDRSSLERLAHPTGGAVWLPRSRQELVGAASEMMRELREQYTLGYAPRTPADGKYRRLKVSARNPDYRVRHRMGYVATVARQSRRRD